jgi:hypothetical protein
LKKAEYPQRSCRQPVAGQWIDHPCELAGAEGIHPGPCASFSVPESVVKRDAWEAANPNWGKMESPFADPFGEVKP